MKKSRASQTLPEPKLVNAAFLKRWALPEPDGGDKESRGSILVVGGTDGMPGAAMLTATAALRAGAGKLKIAAPKCVAVTVASLVPESLVVALAEDSPGVIKKSCANVLLKSLERADAMVIGTGMDSSSAGDKALAAVLVQVLKKSERKTLVIDACAMKALKDKPELTRASACDVIITPHAGEMASLIDQPKEKVLADPVGTATKVAGEYRVTVVMKGPETIIAEPSGKLYRNVRGNSGLGTSGSGDVLAGIIGGLAARGCGPAQAAVWGVYLHAAAGDCLAREMGSLGYLARELLACVPREMEKLRGSRK